MSALTPHNFPVDRQWPLTFRSWQGHDKTPDLIGPTATYQLMQAQSSSLSKTTSKAHKLSSRKSPPSGTSQRHLLPAMSLLSCSTGYSPNLMGAYIQIPSHLCWVNRNFQVETKPQYFEYKRVWQAFGRVSRYQDKQYHVCTPVGQTLWSWGPMKHSLI